MDALRNQVSLIITLSKYRHPKGWGYTSKAHLRGLLRFQPATPCFVCVAAAFDAAGVALAGRMPTPQEFWTSLLDFSKNYPLWRAECPPHKNFGQVYWTSPKTLVG